MKGKSGLRSIPAVEKVLQTVGRTDLPRPAVLAVVRRELAALRRAGTSGDFQTVIARVKEALDSLGQSRIQPVINGTGILIHTNLGRTPLGVSAIETINAIGCNYSTLEYELSSGKRGARGHYLEHNLAILCGAEAATVVNNCAAALLLILRYLTTGSRKEVIISRGELVQIGGGFRIPEILESTGARLREVGTTNITSLRDYEKAIGPGTALLLKVHRSNFSMTGFVESPATAEIAKLAIARRVPFIEDLGSGAVVNTQQVAAIEHEPTPAEVLAQGAQLVCFSGDKLLGSVQAGIIAGRRKLVSALKQEPFFRALRCDKLVLSCLQTTVDHYLSGGEMKIPLLELMRLPVSDLERRAEKLVGTVAGLPITVRVRQGKARLGGGSLPSSIIPSLTIDLAPQNIDLATFAARLRLGSPPVIGYLSAGWYRLDLRTVFASQDAELSQAIRRAL